MKRMPAAVLVLAAEILTAAYLAVMAGLLTSWMVDESVAFRMRDIDWVATGGRRFAVALLVAAVFALVTRLAHRRWAVAARSSAWIRGAPLLLGGGIALAGAAGAVWFVVERPFM